MMASETKKTAVVYCRTSTIGQKESETITAQYDRCAQLVKQHGVQLLPYGAKGDGWIVDDGVSGSLLEGRSFATLIEDLKTRRVRPDYLIVFSLSRIARLDKSSRDMDRLVKSAEDNARIKAVLLGAGVQVIDCDGINDPKNVMFDLKTTLAAEEYKLIRSRTIAGKQRCLAQGRFSRGGKPPYGYRYVDGDAVPHEVDAKNLRRILRWYAYGGRTPDGKTSEGGPTYAATMATAAAIPTPMAATDRRKNKAADWSPSRWSPVSVQHVVDNASIYIGADVDRLLDGKPYKQRYPALIDAELYQALQVRERTGSVKRRITMLSTGLVDCVCGAHVHQHRSHERHHTRCPKGCGRMPERVFSNALWDATVARLVQIQEVERATVGEDDPYLPALKTARARLDDLAEQTDRLLDLYLIQQIDQETFSRRTAPLNEARAKAKAEVARIEHDRKAHADRQRSMASVEAHVDALLADLLGGEPTLEKRRKTLIELLQGSKVLVTWAKPGGAKPTEITLPAFGELPPVTTAIDPAKPAWVRSFPPARAPRRGSPSRTAATKPRREGQRLNQRSRT